MRFEYLSKMQQTTVKKFWLDGMTFEQAYEAYKEYMRAIASKGGQNGKGYEFAHGKANPSLVGKRGSDKRWAKR